MVTFFHPRITHHQVDEMLTTKCSVPSHGSLPFHFMSDYYNRRIKHRKRVKFITETNWEDITVDLWHWELVWLEWNMILFWYRRARVRIFNPLCLWSSVCFSFTMQRLNHLFTLLYIKIFSLSRSELTHVETVILKCDGHDQLNRPSSLIFILSRRVVSFLWRKPRIITLGRMILLKAPLQHTTYEVITYFQVSPKTFISRKEEKETYFLQSDPWTINNLLFNLKVTKTSLEKT